IYTIVYSATDASSNVAYDTVDVRVQEPIGDPAAAAHPIDARVTALTTVQTSPFTPQTMVHFSLATSEHVRISIYDVTGSLVRKFVDDTMPAGRHQARWDGTSDRGTGVPSGIYFVRMMTGSYREVRKIVVQR
ncbi:MAG TPA: FlgD immunoglobulin-like domain containing protein, partial [Candidatus Eisenbacteria bacterium]